MTHSFFSVISISFNEQQTFEPLKELTCHSLADSIGIIGFVTESLEQFSLVNTTLDWAFGHMYLGFHPAQIRCVTLEVGLGFLIMMIGTVSLIEYLF